MRFARVPAVLLVLMCAFSAARAQVNLNGSYASYSFGESSSGDTVIGGLRLYGSDSAIESAAPSEESGNCSYIARSAGDDASYLRTSAGGRSAAAAVRHWCPLRTEGKRDIPGYLYFDAGACFTAENRELTVEIEYFDEGTKPFGLLYVNSADGGLERVSIARTGTGKWRTKKLRLADAYFNGANRTPLGDGACDFRIEALGGTVAIGRVALYDAADEVSGRAYKMFSINGRPTARTYFTQQMWTPDSKRLILRGNDGWLYEYTPATDGIRKLVESEANFYVSPGNFLYYINTRTRTINRVNLSTYADEALTGYPPGSYGAPSYIHTNANDTLLTVQAQENSSELDVEIGENGTPERRYRRIQLYNIKTGEWNVSYTNEFPAGTPHMTHLMINPVYDKLVFFCHEGTTTKIPDRMWTIDMRNGKKKNIFIQQSNSLGADSEVKTGETSGHENWTADGEHMVFVKYPYATNVGRNGIVRIDKYGEKREYINDDYRYWHCHPSADNRFVTADTMLEGVTDGVKIPQLRFGTCNVVLIDAKLSSSTLLARIKAGVTHPYQPHPAFSPDGKMVSFGCVDENELLCVGIMDITDLTAGKKGEVFAGNTNEDRGALVGEIVMDGTAASVRVRATDNISVSLVRGDYDADGRLCGAAIDTAELSEGEDATLSVGAQENSRLFVWCGTNTPLDTEPAPPEALRSVNERGSIVLYWQPPANFIPDGVQYDIYRNGEKIARTEEGFYRDYGFAAGSANLYEVRAVYAHGTVSPPTHLSIDAPPQPDELGCDLSGAESDERIVFTDNAANPAADSYTEHAEIGGRVCRVSTAQVVGDKTKTGKFYFKTDKRYIAPEESSLRFTVEYYDNLTTPLYIEYNAADGSVAKRVQLARRTGSNEWKSASVDVADARFVHAAALSGCDFRIEGGADTYIARAAVKNLSPVKVVRELYAYFAPGDERALGFFDGNTGDSVYTAAERGGRSCIHTAGGKYMYFDVDDNFAEKNSDRALSLTIEYFDEGTGDIYIQYNTNDTTFTGNSAYKGRKIASLENSGKFKRAQLILLDAGFSNAQDNPYFADFRLYSSAGLTLAGVKVSPVLP